MGTGKSTPNTRRIKATWFILIVALATTAGMFCAWRAPALNSSAQDWLMRSRGILPEPDDIVIVAIDESSIAKLGRFPWSREYTARVVKSLSAAQPKVIALDVLYSEPTDETADEALSDAIKKAGNVVIAEQLIEDRETSELSRSVWLRSLSAIEASAAGIGHVNVEAKQDGAARELLLRLADDDGDSRWALALETVRVGDGLNPDEVNEIGRFVRIGTRKIPFNPVER
ncbi:MAG: CHASE2 domain-containing protein, partial [Acidobacteriota bacterium]|nr:CHASE2 domain-containing protein [Acidobacteriota bacterium]